MLLFVFCLHLLDCKFHKNKDFDYFVHFYLPIACDNIYHVVDDQK